MRSGVVDKRPPDAIPAPLLVDYHGIHVRDSRLTERQTAKAHAIVVTVRRDGDVLKRGDGIHPLVVRIVIDKRPVALACRAQRKQIAHDLALYYIMGGT